MFLRSILDLILDFSAVWLVGVVFFNIKVRTEKLWNLGIIMFLYIVAVYLAGVSGEENSFISLTVIIVLWFLMQGNGKEKFKNILKLEFMATLLEFIINAVLTLFMHDDVEQDTKFIIISMILILTMVMVEWMKRRYLLHKNEGEEWIISEKIIYVCACMMGVSLFLTISGLEMEKEYVPYRGFSEFVGILTIILLFSILLLVLFLQYVNDMNRRMKNHLEMERLLKETQKNYYEAMLKKEEDTKRYRHDMLNHLMCLAEIVKSGEKEEITDYIKKLQLGMTEIQHKQYSVGNLVLDAVINYYTKMLENSADVSVLGKCPEEINITQMELCTIFSNLMKNAVEEVKRQEIGEKYLKININVKSKYLKIEIINSIEQKNRPRGGGLPKTVKNDKDNHGFGMRNVKETVEKNGGEFRWLQSETDFWVIVLLPDQVD